MDRELEKQRAYIIREMKRIMAERKPWEYAEALYDAGYTRPAEPSPERAFDGNYHCAYCGQTFRIANQAEFIKHQETCPECKGAKSLKYGGQVHHYCYTCGGSGKAPEPAEDMVDVVAMWLIDNIDEGAGFDSMSFGQAARSILKLCQPEPAEDLVETVELIKEINNILGMCSERSPRWRRVVLSLEALLSKITARSILKLFSPKEMEDGR